eukprot:7732142-Pyramimonas_sp.AAC.1
MKVLRILILSSTTVVAPVLLLSSVVGLVTYLSRRRGYLRVLPGSSPFFCCHLHRCHLMFCLPFV